MTVLLHVSDPHFGTEQAPGVEAVVALARQLQPDLVVLSGDITQRARPAQFRAAIEPKYGIEFFVTMPSSITRPIRTGRPSSAPPSRSAWPPPA